MTDLPSSLECRGAGGATARRRFLACFFGCFFGARARAGAPLPPVTCLAAGMPVRGRAARVEDEGVERERRVRRVVRVVVGVAVPPEVPLPAGWLPVVECGLRGLWELPGGVVGFCDWEPGPLSVVVFPLPDGALCWTGAALAGPAGEVEGFVASAGTLVQARNAQASASPIREVMG